MKKTILYSFLTVLVVGYSENGSAYSAAFGLNSTTMQADELLSSSSTGSSASSSSSESTGSSEDASRKDAYKRLWKKSVFALPMPVGGFMEQFFNTGRKHFKPGSSPIDGTFETNNNCLLNSEEFEMVFADSDIDTKLETAKERIRSVLQSLTEMVNRLTILISGVNTGNDISSELQKTVEKSKSGAAQEQLKKYIEDVKKELNKTFANLDSYKNALNGLKENNDLQDAAVQIISEIKKVEELHRFIVDVFDAKADQALDQFKKSENNPIVNEKIAVNTFKQHFPVVLDRNSDYKKKNLLEVYWELSCPNRRNPFDQLVVYQQNDPRLDYILKYDLEKFDFNKAKKLVTGGIFATLRDRQSRNIFREYSGFSWKDMLDLITYELFVARNKGDLLIKDFLTEVLLDMYDTPEVWVPAKSAAEAKYANEDAKRLAFLMAEGGIRKIHPDFSVSNQATQILQKYVDVIQQVTKNSLQNVENVTAGNAMISLFNSESYEATVEKLIKSGHITEEQEPYDNSTFSSDTQIQVYDCGAVQEKDGTKVSNSCCLNSFLNIYCNNRWIDGVFYLNRLAGNGILNSYFSDLGNQLNKTAKEKTNDDYEDKEVWYNKVVKLRSNDLSYDLVRPVLELILGVDSFVMNNTGGMKEYRKRTIYGPTLAISGSSGHFQGLRLFNKLDQLKGQNYWITSITPFKTGDPTYMEVVAEGTKEDSESEEKLKLVPLSSEASGNLSVPTVEREFVDNIFGWRKRNNITDPVISITTQPLSSPLAASSSSSSSSVEIEAMEEELPEAGVASSSSSSSSVEIEKDLESAALIFGMLNENV